MSNGKVIENGGCAEVISTCYAIYEKNISTQGFVTCWIFGLKSPEDRETTRPSLLCHRPLQALFCSQEPYETGLIILRLCSRKPKGIQ